MYRRTFQGHNWFSARMKSDIQTTQDIQRLVTAFYGKVKDDALLAPKFSHLDWEHHLPIMFSFWESMLLGTGTYKRNPLQPHLALSLDREHFAGWLALWQATVDELFAGNVANDAKERASSIAGMFQYKLGLLPT